MNDTSPARARGPSSRARMLVALALVYLIWGSIYLAVRITIEQAPPFGSMAFRFLVAGLIVGAYVAVRRGLPAFRLSAAELLGTFVLGLSLLAIGNGVVSLAELHGLTSGMVALLIATVPGWIAILRTLSGDRPHVATLLGTATGLAGVLVLVLFGGGSGHQSLPIFPVLLVLFASLAVALGAWSRPRLTLPESVPVSACYQLLFAGAVMLVFAVAHGEQPSLPWNTRTWSALAYLIVFGSVVAFSAYAWLLVNTPVSVIVTHTYVNPIVAVVLGCLVLSEPLSSGVIVGGGIVLLSVVLVLRGEHEHPVADAELATAPDRRVSTHPVITPAQGEV